MSGLWTNSTLQFWTALTGTLFSLYAVTNTARFAWNFVRPSRLHQYRHADSGSWALVTGASDGIGFGFVQELLAQGFNVLLHGRNRTKLEGLQSDLQKEFSDQKIDIVVADASQYDDSYKAITEKVRTLPGKLTVLVNNVGGIHTTPTYLPHQDVPHDDIDACINVNLRFATHLIKDLIPVLRSKGPALLANIGSVGGIMGVPYITTYCGTKAYMHVLTESLKNETVAEGIDSIDMVAFLVGNVSSHTNTFDMPLTITSRQCAASCLAKAGKNSEALVWGHWKFVIAAYFTMMLPKMTARRLLGSEMRKRVEAEKKSG